MNQEKMTMMDTLWNDVQAEPNELDRLTLWIQMGEKESGDRGAREALRRVANLPGSWLAKIWSTRILLLEEGRLEDSLEIYRNVLRLAPRKSLAVQEISGHLGEAGYFQEAVELLLPIYSPDDHGPWAGFNLFNLCEDARDLDSAQEVLDRMKTADWHGEFRVWGLKKIIGIRQEKLNILREMSGETTPCSTN